MKIRHVYLDIFLILALVVATDKAQVHSQDAVDRFTSAHFEESKRRWIATLDRKDFLSDEKQHSLLSKNISYWFDVPKGKVVVDRVGIRVSQPLYGKNEKYWSNVRDDLASDLHKQLTADQFADLLVGYKEKIDNKFKAKDGAVCLFFTLGRHGSVIRKQQEMWLIAELELLPSVNDIYVNDRIRDRRDKTILLVPVPVHPEVEELEFLRDNVEWVPLVANRPAPRPWPGETPLLPLEDDGMTENEREQAYGFVVNNSMNLKEYQIESLAYVKDDLSPNVPFELYFSSLQQRLPLGRVVTHDQLHRILGEFAQKQQELFRGMGHTVVIGFEVKPYRHGKMTYTRIVYTPILR